MTQDEFLASVSPYNDHLPLLWLALEATTGIVAEFGSGNGSTPFLRQYCADAGREFVTYDNNIEWCEITGSEYIENWNTADIYKEYSVCLIDHAPGEHRHQAIAILKDKAQILVVHDSEPVGSGNYMLNKIWPLFKFKVNVKSEGAWATAISNHIDVTQWAGMELAGFRICE